MKKKNYLTDLRDSYMYSWQRTLMNCSAAVVIGILAQWLGSLFGWFDEPTLRTLVGAVIAVSIVVLTAYLINQKWPIKRQPE